MIDLFDEKFQDVERFLNTVTDEPIILYIECLIHILKDERIEFENKIATYTEKYGGIETYVEAYNIAQLFAYANELDQAFEWLEKAYH